MKKTDIIDKAIGETLKVHPNFIDFYASTLTSIIQNYVNPSNFTSKNGIRESISDCSSIDFLKYALDEIIKIYAALSVLHPKVVKRENMSPLEWNEVYRTFPETNRILKITYEIKNIRGNIISYYKSNQSKLFYLLDTILKIRFNRRFFDSKEGLEYSYQQGQNFRNQIDHLAKKAPEYKDLQAKLEKSFKPYQNINYITFNPKAINQCVREIVSGTQVQHQHNEYTVDGSLFATQDIGKRRHNQEDSILIMTHPNNTKFKLLAVADGMGGAHYGEEVSNYIVVELNKWFNNVPKEFYFTPTILCKELIHCVLKINDDVVNKYHSKHNVNAGSTLVCAIITKHQTIILNVGDSRAYCLKDHNLDILTEDESVVWNQMKYQVQQEQRDINLNDISELRFDPLNNQITRAIGFPNLPEPQVNIINNNQYDRLLLFSDGVHDVLSSEDIKIIANTTSPEEITKVIVETAISKDAEKRNKRGNIEKVISAGKDNTTAAAYIRR